MIHVDRKDIPAQILNAFPEYTGKKFRIMEANQYSPRNYWDEGSRSRFRLVELASGEVTSPHPDTTNPFHGIAHATFEIPTNHAVVEHTFTCGKDAGLFIYTPPQNLTKFLPNTQQIILTQEENMCLTATQKYKASYGGVSRREQIGMRPSVWETAKAGLIEKGLLKKNGALTTTGKNFKTTSHV